MITDDKILVFDADVIIHFIQGNRFSDLRFIYPNNSKIILDKVSDELRKRNETALMLDNAEKIFGILRTENFSDRNEIKKEYALLISPINDYGKGESACMSYCRYTENVVVSSNLSDVKEYCENNKIDLLTTLDLVKWAFDNLVWTEIECDTFLINIRKIGANIPYSKISEYSLSLVS